MKKKFISVLTNENVDNEIYTPASIQLPKGEVPVFYHGSKIGKAILKFDENSSMIIAEGTIDEE